MRLLAQLKKLKRSIHELFEAKMAGKAHEYCADGL
jgi:hypothetical protein